MANEAAAAAAGVDSVSEGAAEASPDLESWAQDEGHAAGAESAAAPAAAAPVTRGDPRKGADAIAARGGQPRGAPAKPAVEARSKLPYDPAAKVKIVVDGEEEEITIEEAFRRARKNSAADKRFQEASRIRQEAESLRPLEQFRGVFSPEDVQRAQALLRDRNLNPTDPKLLRAALGEVAVLEVIEREKLEKENPAELARREEQRKREAAEAELKRREDAEKSAEQERTRQQIRETYNKQFSTALAKHDLPATPYTVMRMAELTQENLRMGLDLTAEEIAPLVKEDLSRETAAMVKGLPLDQAMKLLPKSFLDELRKYDLAQARVSPGTRSAPPAPLGRVPERRSRGQRFTKPIEAQEALDRWAEGR